MIHLDTNVLIGAANRATPWPARLRTWLLSGEQLAVSAIVWAEFLNGPLTRQNMRDASLLLEGRILPFGVSEAELAAQLFNRTARKRGTQPDCFIAATAMCSGAALATENRKHFAPFIQAGLRLV